MMMRIGIELIALGRLRCGLAVSAAVVPTSSMPTKANTAIWKPAKKPLIPFGKKPSSFHRLATEAWCPVGEVKPQATSAKPVTISAQIATILISANQNSISPNSFTVTRLRLSSSSTHSTAGIHGASPGNQNCVYAAMAMTSAIAVMIQQNQKVQPQKKPAHGPSRSVEKSMNDLYSRFDSSS